MRKEISVATRALLSSHRTAEPRSALIVQLKLYQLPNRNHNAAIFTTLRNRTASMPETPQPR